MNHNHSFTHGQELPGSHTGSVSPLRALVSQVELADTDLELDDSPPRARVSTPRMMSPEHNAHVVPMDLDSPATPMDANGWVASANGNVKTSHDDELHDESLDARMNGGKSNGQVEDADIESIDESLRPLHRHDATMMAAHSLVYSSARRLTRERRSRLQLIDALVLMGTSPFMVAFERGVPSIPRAFVVCTSILGCKCHSGSVHYNTTVR